MDTTLGHSSSQHTFYADREYSDSRRALGQNDFDLCVIDNRIGDLSEEWDTNDVFLGLAVISRPITQGQVISKSERIIPPSEERVSRLELKKTPPFTPT